VVGGLLRAGVSVSLPASADWPGNAVTGHAFLMVFAFLGTVIGIERAVAVKHWAAFVAPALSAAAGLSLLAGSHVIASSLAIASAAVFAVVNAELTARQPAAHTRLLLASAFALLVANGMFAMNFPASVIAPWWFSFLVLTIAAERLEMTRLMRRRRGAAASLYACLGTMLVACVTFGGSPVVGGALFGAALSSLALWLLSFDIARKTVRTHGLSRYMAICLLFGYAWLGVAGIAWMLAAAGYPTRDAALHALGLGFIFSMMLGHAPVIVPALAGTKVAFGWFFYVPLGLLQVSLTVRLIGRFWSFEWVSAGAACNSAAIALFGITMLVAVMRRRRSHSLPRTRTS
jgi:hypothetical protein